MALNGINSGKFLKPFLCLIRNAHHDVLTNQSPVTSKLYHLNKNIHVKRLTQAFPYYAKADLDHVFDVLSLHLAGSVSDEVPRLFDYYFSGVFRKQSEQISASRLYHFVPKKFLLGILERRFVYPSVVTCKEYKALFKQFKASAYLEKEGVLQDKIFLKTWTESNDKLIALRDTGSDQATVDSFLENDAYLPAYSCFTELNESVLSLHAEHYGSYGLSFAKNEIVMKKRLNATVANQNFIRPIHYCDNTLSNTPWLLLDRITKTTDRSERLGLFTDLLLIKPIEESLFHPEYIYSVLHEREWRFVSSKKCFSFDLKQLDTVAIPRADYQQWLDTKNDPALEGILKFCKKVS